MKKYLQDLKNQKGFTLVELLAVIVILALIMAIAIISMSGIMQNARENTYKETALQIINGVRNQLLLENETNAGEPKFQGNGTDYVFTEKILEKGGKTSPLGGTIKFSSGEGTAIGSMGVYRKGTGTGVCNGGVDSYVNVTYSNNRFVYKICLTSGAEYRYIYGTEDELLGNVEGANPIKNVS